MPTAGKSSSRSQNGMGRRVKSRKGLEQLRFLEHNVRIRVVETEYPTIGVDIPCGFRACTFNLEIAAVNQVVGTNS